MPYYHCSPTPGLTTLEPRRPAIFRKEPRVYMTTLLPMALMYGIQNFEYTYGYTKEGQIYLAEYFPNALEILYRGHAASLYLCAPGATDTTKIPNEVTSPEPVAVLQEIRIPDLCEALLEQERLGQLEIRRYDTLPQKGLDWILRTEADCIQEYDALHQEGPMADYYRTHYPASWELALQKQNTL